VWSYGSLISWQGVLDLTHSHKRGGRGHMVVGFHGKVYSI